MNQESTTVGRRYQLLQELGRGDSSITYLAQDLALPNNPYCVVKEFNLAIAPENLWSDIKTLCSTKASLWLKLAAHNQIPQLLAYFEEQRQLYLVQEYIAGKTLAQQLQKPDSIDRERVVYWLQDLLTSLQIIHQNNIIHGDIKPEHIVIREHDRKAFLVDFGIFKAIDSRFSNSAQATSFTSNNSYYPTEVVGEPTAKSDIYALGAILIQALTNIPPDCLPRNPETEELQWSPSVEVDPKLASILAKTVSLNPENSYTSTSEVIADLQKLPLFSIASKIMDFERTSPQHFQDSYRSPSLTQINATSTKPKRKFNWSYVWLPFIGVVILLGILELVIPTIRPLYYLDRGKNLLEEHPQIALDNFQQSIKLKPKSAEAWKARGDALFNLERLRAALTAYDRSSQLDPNYAEAWKGRGEVLYRLERFEAASTAYDKALQLEPNDAEILNRKGRALYKLERYQQALATQEAALKIEPKNAHALSDRGIALIGLGQYQDALVAFSRAQAIEPLNPQFWQNKALALQLLRRPQEASRLYQEALTAYDRVIEENPNNVIAIVDKANVLSQLQQHQQALATYQQALEVNPDSHLAWLGRGNALFALRQYDEALKAFNRTVKIQPESYLTWHNRGSLLRDGLKKLPEAIASYDRAVQINPSFYHAWRDRGFAFSQNNDHLKAIESFKKALNIKADDYKSWVGQGIAFSSLNQVEEAIAAFDRAAEIQPQDPFVWMNRGSALERARRYTPACDAYRRVTKLNPGFTPAIQAIKRIGCKT